MMRYLQRFLRIYQGFVVSGAIVLFGVVALLFAVIPGIRTTVALYDDLGELEGQIKNLSAKLSFLESLREEELRGQVAELLAAVPEEKSVPTILGTIEGLAQQTVVTIDDMSLTSPGSLATGSAARQSAAEKKIGASGLPFSLNASGTYEAVRDFVGKINAVRRLFDVTSFDVSTSGTGETKLRLSLTAFYQPLPSSIGSVESPVARLSEKDRATLENVLQFPDVSPSSGVPLTPILTDGKRDPFATR